MSAIETVLWPGCRALAPTVSEFGGILARKPGYHNSRNHLISVMGRTSDYSVILPLDKVGPGDKGSALDWTFDDAQKGNFATIAKFSKRLYVAGVNNDPRAYPLREFYGNTDTDRTVEGWDYYRDRAVSSDDSHLWHIHMSIHRKYIDDANAMKSILAILSGAPSVPVPPPPSTGLPYYRNGLRELSHKTPNMRGTDVRFVQRFIGSRCGVADGVFGSRTKSGVIWYQQMRGLTADGIVGARTWDALGY